MVAKKIVYSLISAISVSFICTGCFLKKDTITATENSLTKPIPQQASSTKTTVEKKYDLYSESLYDLPLVSIVDINTLSKDIKKVVNNVLEQAQGFYYLKKYDDKIFIILQNPVSNINSYVRHNLEFAEINENGEITYHTAGYTGVDGEISNVVEQKNDLWVFDETVEPFRPKKHTFYDEKGKIKFIESWNYEDSEPIKYQMKNANKKVVSIYKESQDNDSNLRKEHIFYDNDGNTKMSLTINYEGPNISRLTFYNSHDTIDSVSIINEFSEGLKVKETVYNEDYEVEKKILSDYNDGIRKSITVLDSEDNIITELKP